MACALLTPWVGPHVDRYLPLGGLLLRARTESPDAAFWIIAALLLAVAYGVWFALLSGLSAWLARRREL